MKKRYKLFINICIIAILLFSNIFALATEIEQPENTNEENVQVINETLEINENTEEATDELDDVSDEEVVVSESIQIGDKPLIELVTGNVAPGEEFEVSVYVSSEKGLSSAEFTIKYDNRLEYIQEIAQNEVTYTIEKNKEEQKIQVAIANDDDITERTLVTKLKFKAPKDTNSENYYEIAVEKVDTLFSSQNGEIFNYEVVNLLIGVNDIAEQSKINYTTIIICAAVIAVLLIVFIIMIKKVKSKR